MKLRLLALVLGLFTASLVTLAPAPAVRAQDKDKDKAAVTQAKNTAIANLKKANIDKPTVVETANFIIVGTISEEKAKALGEVLEKVNTLSRKTLKFDDKDYAWKGKLTVYYMPDNTEFKALMRRAFQQPPESVYVDFRSEPAFIVDPADAVGKLTDADLYNNTAARIAGESLKAKGIGTQNIPEWLRDGYGRATAYRAEGTTSKRFTAYRTQARTAILGPKGGKPPALADVWGTEKSANSDVLATSFADYLAYGPGAAKFITFIEALRPSENVAEPTVQQGLDSAGWKEKDLPMLEAAWRRWVSTGK